MSDENAIMPIAATRAEVAAQPAVIARVLREKRGQVQEIAQSLFDRRVNHVLATGSGDSWFAAQAVRMAWECYASVCYEAMQAYEYAAYGLQSEEKRTAYFIISSSGRPTTTWDALDRSLGTRNFVVGVTDIDSSKNPFITRPSVSLIPGAVKEGWPAQTTTATIALLLDLAIAYGALRGSLDPHQAKELRRQLEAIPDQMVQTLQKATPWAESLASTLDGNRFFTFVGSGPGHAVAQNGAVLMAEGPQAVGVAMPVEEFHHGLRVATLMEGEPVVLIAQGGKSDPRCRDTARVVRSWGARLIPLVTPDGADLLGPDDDGFEVPDVPEAFSPLLMLMPLHALSIALAEHKVARGYQRPDRVPE